MPWNWGNPPWNPMQPTSREFLVIDFPGNLPMLENFMGLRDVHGIVAQPGRLGMGWDLRWRHIITNKILRFSLRFLNAPGVAHNIVQCCINLLLFLLNAFSYSFNIFHMTAFWPLKEVSIGGTPSCDEKTYLNPDPVVIVFLLRIPTNSCTWGYYVW